MTREGGGRRFGPLWDALALLLRTCRALVAVPVAVLGLSAIVAFGYSCYVLASVVLGLVTAPHDTGRFVVTLVKVADVVLIGVVLFVAAVGLEELFLSEHTGHVRAWLPKWLAVNDLNDLKETLLSALVLVVVVTFVDAAISPSPGLEVLELGAATAAVVAAIALYLRLTAGRTRAGRPAPRVPPHVATRKGPGTQDEAGFTTVRDRRRR